MGIYTTLSLRCRNANTRVIFNEGMRLRIVSGGGRSRCGLTINNIVICNIAWTIYSSYFEYIPGIDLSVGRRGRRGVGRGVRDIN